MSRVIDDLDEPSVRGHLADLADVASGAASSADASSTHASSTHASSTHASSTHASSTHASSPQASSLAASAPGASAPGAPSQAAAALTALRAEWPAIVLIADDDDGARTVLRRILERAGYQVLEAADGERARQLVSSIVPDLVILDITMPGADGVAICREIKAAPATSLTPVVHVTGSTDRVHRLAAIEAGSDEFVAKPFDIQELLTRVRSLLRTRRLTTQLVSAEAVMVALARTVEARDLYTERHLTRVAQRAVRVATALGVDARTLETVRLGGLLHDLGKIAVPDSVLLKEGALSRAEFELIKLHPAKGADIVKPLTRFSAPGPVVLHHHEHFDGSGYPEGLRGERIPYAARIVAVADAFDAMTTTRPYRTALPVEVAFERLKAGRARQWDGSIVDAFVLLYEQGLDEPTSS